MQCLLTMDALVYSQACIPTGYLCGNITQSWLKSDSNYLGVEDSEASMCFLHSMIVSGNYLDKCYCGCVSFSKVKKGNLGHSSSLLEFFWLYT